MKSMRCKVKLGTSSAFSLCTTKIKQRSSTPWPVAGTSRSMLSGSYKPGFMYAKITDGLHGRSCYNTGLFYMRFRVCSLGKQKTV